VKSALPIDLGRLAARLRALPLALPADAGRWPLLSLGLAAVLLLALPIVEVGFGHRVSAAEERVLAAVDYAIHHPEVEIPPQLVSAVRAWLPEFEGNEAFAFLRDAQGQRGVRASQQEFDVLAAEALSAVDAHPHRALGLVPRRLAGPGLVTHPLLHAGWVDGLATLALLVLLGPVLERGWGRRWTAALLLVASGVGALVFALLERGGDRPLVGAGAGVSALAAAALVHHRGRRLAPLEWLPAVPPLRAPSWGLAPLWLAYLGLVCGIGGGGLPGGFEPAAPWAACAAGAVTGALAALGAVRLGIAPPPATRADDRPVRSAGRFDFEQVRALRARGQAERAYALLEAEVGRSVRNRDAVVTFFEMSVERGEPRRALAAMRGLIAEELRRGAAPVAVGHWRTLCEHLADPALEPALLVRLIPLIRDEDGDEVARVALRQATGAGVERLPTALARELAELSADLSPRLAAQAARRALAAEGLRPDERSRLEALAERGQEAESADPVAAEARRKDEERELPRNVFYDEQDRSQFGRAGGELGELTAPGDEDLLYPAPSGAAEAPAAAPSSAPQVTAALPLRLTEDALLVQLREGGRAQLPFAHLHAVAAAGVRGLGPRPVVLIDLLVSGAGPGGRPRRVVRLRSDSFDPRPFAPGAGSPLAALRGFVDELARRAGGELLCPAADGPIRVFDSLDAYTREVLAAHI